MRRSLLSPASKEPEEEEPEALPAEPQLPAPPPACDNCALLKLNISQLEKKLSYRKRTKEELKVLLTEAEKVKNSFATFLSISYFDYDIVKYLQHMFLRYRSFVLDFLLVTY